MVSRFFRKFVLSFCILFFYILRGINSVFLDGFLMPVIVLNSCGFLYLKGRNFCEKKFSRIKVPKNCVFRERNFANLIKGRQLIIIFHFSFTLSSLFIRVQKLQNTSFLT